MVLIKAHESETEISGSMDSLLISHLKKVQDSNNKGKKDVLRKEREFSSHLDRARKEGLTVAANRDQIVRALTVTQPRKKSRKALKKLVKAQTGSKDRTKLSRKEIKNKVSK